MNLTEPDTVEELIDLVEDGRDMVAGWSPLDIRPGDSPIRLVDGRIIGPRPGDGEVSEESFANVLVKEFAQKHNFDLLVPNGIYYRWTTRPEEPAEARERLLRPSRNHRTEHELLGLAVAEGPWFYFLTKPWCWLVSGCEESRGPDGEPLLDLSSLVMCGPIVARRDVLTQFHERNRDRLAALSNDSNVPEVELFALLTCLI